MFIRLIDDKGKKVLVNVFNIHSVESAEGATRYERRNKKDILSPKENIPIEAASCIQMMDGAKAVYVKETQDEIEKIAASFGPTRPTLPN